jgi:regulatory protein
MLSRKERTSSEVRDWLEEREDDEIVVDEVISRLEEALVVDDQRFAVEFARDKRNISGWGKSRIGAALVQRGVPGDLVELALTDDESTEADRACELLLAKGFRLEDPADRQRGLGFLSRKGFTAEDSYEAVRRAARETGLEVPDLDR